MNVLVSIIFFFYKATKQTRESIPIQIEYLNMENCDLIWSILFCFLFLRKYLTIAWDRSCTWKLVIISICTGKHQSVLQAIATNITGILLYEWVNFIFNQKSIRFQTCYMMIILILLFSTIFHAYKHKFMCLLCKIFRIVYIILIIIYK